MRSGAEVEQALGAFAKRWTNYTASEKSEAQTFLNELFAAYGTDRKAVGALFEDFKSSAGFLDLQAPHKAPDEAVSDAYGWPQAIGQDNDALVSRLRDLNRRIVEGEVAYAPFA